MSDKKRKLAVEAGEPDVKKAKKEKKEKKKDKSSKVKEAVEETAPVVQEEVAEKKEKKEKKDKKEKEEKKEKKEKKAKDSSAEQAQSEDAMDVDVKQPEEAPAVNGSDKKDKKEKKDKKKEKKEKKEKKAQEAQAQPNGAQSEAAEPEAGEAASSQKGNRFIVFVGNLPYSANTESLTKHFEKIAPASVRVATQKDKPTHSRGFGFVEFDNYDRMKTCLKLYHHSSFDDGKYPPRRINVELTAGGGGNTEYRKSKIEAKNKKLFEERQRAVKQTKQENHKASAAPADEGDDFAGVHPSRRRQMA